MSNSKFRRVLLGVTLILLSHGLVRAGVSRIPSPSAAGPVETDMVKDRASDPVKVHPALQQLLNQSTGPVKVWVFFKDKGIDSPQEYEAAIAQVAASYNPRAVQRRALRGLNALRGGALFDEHDLPVVQAYVDAVAATGARIHVVSRWVNAVSAYITREQVEPIAALPWVAKLQPVAHSAGVHRPVDTKSVEELAPAPGGGGLDRSINYGLSQAQLAQINLIPLHDAGYTAQGVIVGILDTGFHRTHEAFTNPGHPVSVVAEYDFVDNDGVAETEPGDPFGQADHGTMILGCLGAYMPGELVGGAFDASFVLCKTEDTTQEVPAEEDNYVAGLEFIEFHGADMETSSLGYIDWYTQADLDGETAVTTIAVNIATANGVHHCNAAGNEYHDTSPSTSHLIAPADAFQAISCGAVDSSGAIAYFSSDGPTADGRVKPELLARGISTYTVSPSSDTGYTTADGTSLSTPLVACAVACLIQARPSWTVDQMREHLFETADYYVAYGTFDPLYVRGYGILDAFAAYQHAPALIISLPDGAPSFLPPGQPASILVQINDGDESVLPGTPMLHYRFDGGTYLTSPLSWLGGNLYQATLPALPCGSTPEFYFSATGDGGTTVYNPENAPTGVYTATVATTILIDDFDADQGWTVQNIALATGSWERAIPAGDGNRGDPPNDFDGSGYCYVTDNRVGNFDVDGGPTRLISPSLDLSGSLDPLLRYARWFTNDDSDADRLEVAVSNDQGASWTLIESVPDTAGWVQREVHLADYLTLTSVVQVRFSTQDNPNNSVTEAGVDAVQIFDVGCLVPGSGDFDGDGDVDGLDFSHWSDCMTGPSTSGGREYGDVRCAAFDFDFDDDVDLDDFAEFQIAFTW
ncbi:MAG: S8 family serine peptidase [Planctomycetota bacterium]